MAVFAKECMDADCRAIPFDEEAVKVGRGREKVDILHERFFRFDELDKELYWTGWSAKGQFVIPWRERGYAAEGLLYLSHDLYLRGNFRIWRRGLHKPREKMVETSLLTYYLICISNAKTL